MGQAASTGREQAVLTPGDSVRISVWRRPEFSGDFVVASDGSVMHPVLRGAKVGGVPLATAESNLRQVLATYDQNPQFVMEPLLRVAVSGEVVRPQIFGARPETTLAEAVARAGGLTPMARRNRVHVIRSAPGGQREFLVDLGHPDQGVAASPIRSGDLIVVERNRSVWREVVMPALGVAGSIASIGLLIRRYNN